MWILNPNIYQRGGLNHNHDQKHFSTSASNLKPLGQLTLIFARTVI
jgi:hypothetical protein